MPDNQPSGFEEIARRFSDLWQALTHDGPTSRPDGERRLLVDRIRDALDRGESRLATADSRLIANTYRIDDTIRAEGMTELFRARHRDTGSLHAIKTLAPDHANDPVARTMLLREAEIGLSLRHPNIVATQALLRLDDGRPAIVFEYCDQSLADCLASGPIPPADIVAIATAILQCLAVIHEASIIHCDLSPANLILRGKSPDTLAIADFGIALAAGETHQGLDIRFAGQPEFSAPEQTAGGPIDHRADLYSIGRILALMLQHGSIDRPHPLKALADQLSRPEPEHRPETAKAALQMLGGL